MTNEHSLITKLKESTLSISLTAALIIVASIVIVISSITIQSAYMWLAVGATAVLFLGFCSCTTCEKTAHFHFTRRGSVRSDSISTISDGRDNFFEVTQPGSTPEYWITDLPPSYAVATAMPPSLDNQLPPPYSSIVSIEETAPTSVHQSSKPREQSDGIVSVIIPTRTPSGNADNNNNSDSSSSGSSNNNDRGQSTNNVTSC